MAVPQAGRSGRVFFLATLFLVVLAIMATVLLANGYRNLNLVLDRFGYPPLSHYLEMLAPSLSQKKPENALRTVKGGRLPPPVIAVPVHAFSGMKAGPQTFLRRILSDPRPICDRLRSEGFPDMAWTVSAGNAQGFECSSIQQVGAPSGDESGLQSSVFVSVKGEDESRIGSFRVKLNIENPSDAERVADIGSRAAETFLRQVRWENDGDVIRRIKALEPFDLRDFGSHIQFRREFGDVPRYNFLANPLTNRMRPTSGERYFDRRAWLPLGVGAPAFRPMMLPRAETPARTD